MDRSLEDLYEEVSGKYGTTRTLNFRDLVEKTGARDPTELIFFVSLNRGELLKPDGEWKNFGTPASRSLMIGFVESIQDKYSGNNRSESGDIHSINGNRNKRKSTDIMREITEEDDRSVEIVEDNNTNITSNNGALGLRPSNIRFNHSRSRATSSSSSSSSSNSIVGVSSIRSRTAIKAANEALVAASADGNQDTCKLLISENGADVNYRDYYGKTPIGVAAFYGHKVVCDYLKEMGADVDGASTRDWPPLHWAAFQGRVEMFNILRSLGADINKQTRKGKETPLHMAAKSNRLNICMLLVANGANVLLKNSRGKIPGDLTKDIAVRDFLIGRK
jgi:hypothetical protein